MAEADAERMCAAVEGLPAWRTARHVYRYWCAKRERTTALLSQPWSSAPSNLLCDHDLDAGLDACAAINGDVAAATGRSHSGAGAGACCKSIHVWTT